MGKNGRAGFCQRVSSPSGKCGTELVRDKRKGKMYMVVARIMLIGIILIAGAMEIISNKNK